MSTGSAQQAALAPAGEDLSDVIAEKLGAAGRLSREVAERARRIAAEQGEPLGATLVKLGLVSERELAETYAEALKLPLAQIEDYPAEPVLEDKLSARFLRQARLLPLIEAPSHVVIAAADPSDRSAIGAVEIALGRPVRLRVAVPAELEAAMDRLYGGAHEGVAEIVSEQQNIGGLEDADIDRLRDLASEAPVVRLVNHLIMNAAERGASDIHIEPFEHSHRVRYRIDGTLTEVEAPPKQYHAAIVSAHQDPFASRYRRAAQAAGRAHQHLLARPADRYSRLLRADAAWRERRLAPLQSRIGGTFACRARLLAEIRESRP